MDVLLRCLNLFGICSGSQTGGKTRIGINGMLFCFALDYVVLKVLELKILAASFMMSLNFLSLVEVYIKFLV